MTQMIWSEEDLQALPISDGFRLRGKDVTRLETFVDAAFAFAVTMVVISVSSIPNNYQEMLTALKDVPAFAASFTLLMLFWSGHRTWSRRYGLEDGWSLVISLGLIFVMLVYVYPLKLVFSAFFAWISRGWLPAHLTILNYREMVGLFVIYGIGYGALAGAMALLHRRARWAAVALRLSTIEQVRTNQQIVSWTTQAVTGLASAAIAGLLSPSLGIWAGFVYCTLPMTMPLIARRYEREAERAAGLNADRV